jgi:hypothetical protein
MKKTSSAEYAGIARRRRNFGCMDQAQWVNGLQGKAFLF